MSGHLVFCTAVCLTAATSLGLAEDYADGAIKSVQTSAGEVLTDAKGIIRLT